MSQLVSVLPPAQDQPALDGVDILPCPVQAAARIIGQKWTIQIVHSLLSGTCKRFCELQEDLGGVNPSTLSSRLKMLEDEGVVDRCQISDIPPHVEYSLTEMGRELAPVITEVARWSNRWLCNAPCGDM
jgi:DNA-binding HxlR family transcriptional regulator